MSNRKKVNTRKLAERMAKVQGGQRPVLNWKDARKRGYRVPKGARMLMLLAFSAVLLTACAGAITTRYQPAPTVTVTKTVAAPAVTVTRTVTASPRATAAPPPDNAAVAVYPAWSSPGETVPSWLQPYVPRINGATAFTIVDCSAYQCTGSPGAGPDGSTCGQAVQGEQVCVR